MLEDILNTAQKKTIEGKEYSFEFNHSALALLQKETGKSPYEIYEAFMIHNSIMLEDSAALVGCAMLKHHNDEEIKEIKEKMQNYPGFWYELKEPVVTSFIMPMLPPEILQKTFESAKITPKKKVKKAKK